MPSAPFKRYYYDILSCLSTVYPHSERLMMMMMTVYPHSE